MIVVTYDIDRITLSIMDLLFENLILNDFREAVFLPDSNNGICGIKSRSWKL